MPVHISKSSAIQAVQSYNDGRYRGRSNLDVDRDAYSRFNKVLPERESELIECIRFVGEDFGGAQRRFLPHSYTDEAKAIVANLRPVLNGWNVIVESTRPLSQSIPSEVEISMLFAPFVGTKRWPVWATKTLHFLRPDAFPILDSRVKKALGLQSLGSTARDYHRFCAAFLEAMQNNAESIESARQFDRSTSPSDIKLLDKILYQLGA